VTAGRGPRSGVTRVVAFTLVAVVTGCSGDDRPGPEAWTDRWEAARELVPAADALHTNGGTCDRLLGDFRTVLPTLTPTPDDALDGAVDAWVREAESLALDCPTDRAEIDDRLTELEILADEIDAGLADLT
jgi:hypothetical protein